MKSGQDATQARIVQNVKKPQTSGPVEYKQLKTGEHVKKLKK